MKLEIEVTEAEIKAAIERKIRVAIADESNSYRADQQIKDAVKKQWSEVVMKTIDECLADSPALKAKILASIEAKLKGQLTVMMRAAK